MEDSTKGYYDSNIKSLKTQLGSKNVPTAAKNDMAQDLHQTQMKLRKGVRTEFNEDAPVNAVGDGSGMAGMKGGVAPAGKPANWNEPGVTKTKYAKKNAEDQKKNPVMAMVARTPLKTFREFLEK